MQNVLRLNIGNDSDAENPAELDGQWSIYSFGRRHINYRDPDDFFPLSIGLRRKLEVGTAFLLSYHEHGRCAWYLRGGAPSRPFDTVDVAGILLWDHPVSDMGARSYADRAQDAQAFLDTYTAWCNGDCPWYSLEADETMEYAGGCGGFYDAESLSESVIDDLRAYALQHGYTAVSVEDMWYPEDEETAEASTLYVVTGRDNAEWLGRSDVRDLNRELKARAEAEVKIHPAA